jgi:hypothetical protein
LQVVDLKRTAADKKAEEKKYSEAPIGGGGDDYPYGLRICLDAATLKKLSLKPLKVGGRVSLSGFADVVACSMSDSQYGESCSMDLQITDLELSPQDAKSAASAFYGDDDGGL